MLAKFLHDILLHWQSVAHYFLLHLTVTSPAACKILVQPRIFGATRAMAPFLSFFFASLRVHPPYYLFLLFFFCSDLQLAMEKKFFRSPYCYTLSTFQVTKGPSELNQDAIKPDVLRSLEARMRSKKWLTIAWQHSIAKSSFHNDCKPL